MHFVRHPGSTYAATLTKFPFNTKFYFLKESFLKFILLVIKKFIICNHINHNSGYISLTFFRYLEKKEALWNTSSSKSWNSQRLFYLAQKESKSFKNVRAQHKILSELTCEPWGQQSPSCWPSNQFFDKRLAIVSS